MNKMGYESIDDVLQCGVNLFFVCVFKVVWVEEEVIVIDICELEDFMKGFVFGFIFFGLDNIFVFWVGILI